jgi:mRNA-degrading endonuclease toxin of MazEF toxin-antitoxin module
VPSKAGENEMLLSADKENGLRKESILKVDRIVTAKKHDIIARIGKLSSSDATEFKEKFRNLIGK